MQFFLFIGLVSENDVNALVGRIASLGYKVGPASAGGDLFTPGERGSFGVLAALEANPLTITSGRIEKREDPQIAVMYDLKKALNQAPKILFFSAVVVQPNENPAKSITWSGGNVIPAKEETKETKEEPTKEEPTKEESST